MYIVKKYIFCCIVRDVELIRQESIVRCGVTKPAEFPWSGVYQFWRISAVISEDFPLFRAIFSYRSCRFKVACNSGFKQRGAAEIPTPGNSS
jgi:hypothetical protein